MSDSTFETPFLKTLQDKQNVYDRFVPDQVLTHHNLNKIIDYFEDESRQTRVYTIGVGIGCGLDFEVTKNENDKTVIKIQNGVGITTDGDLIVVNRSNYENSPYELALATPFENKANYSKFEDLKLFELHSVDNADNLQDKQPLDDFSNLDQYYLLAYVENFSENPGLCSGTGCDDTGEQVYVNLKFLLVDKTGFNQLSSAEQDSLFHEHNILDFYDKLPEFAALKPWISSNNSNSLGSIYSIFREAIETNNVPKQLFESFVKILEYFNNRLPQPLFKISKLDLFRSFQDIFQFGQSAVLDIQYRYDLLNDLIETYSDIKTHLLHLKTFCVPDISAFPKHLLLGAIQLENRESSRHQFYPSKLSNSDDEYLAEIVSLMSRFYHQVTQYYLHKRMRNEHDILITPSKDYAFSLGERSIPYYYATDENLVKHWNFEDHRNRRASFQLGYHKTHLLKKDFVRNPLKYRHIGHDFYRIEGHVGKSFKEVIARLKKDKHNYNLAFDVKTISIGNPIEDLNIKDYRCQFEDLTTLLKAWRDEFDCLLRGGFDFFKKYNYKEPGKNDTKTRYSDFLKNINRFKDEFTVVNFKDTFNFPKVLVDEEEEKPQSTNLIERIENPVILETHSTREFPMMKKSVVSQEQGFLIQNATDYAVQITNSYDPDVLFKVTKEHILENVGRYEDEVEEMIYVDIPAKIITDMIAVEATFADDIQIYTKETALDQFKKNLSKLCFDLSKAKEDIVEARGKEVFGKKKRDSMYEFMVYELSKLCCFKSKIDWLVKEIEKRKQEIFKKLRLSELVKEHPGLEHLAGVPKGGTFLVVYEGANPQTKTFSDRVVADFCLPYMCVSDCTPDMVVINQQVPVEESLGLDKTVFCIIEGTEVAKGKFTVEPEDTIISSDQGDSFIVSNQQFDPNKVKDDLLGLTISFKVNDKPAGVSALVFKIPSEEYFNNPDHLVIEVSKNDDNESASVVVTPKTPFDNKAYLTYLWRDESGNEVSTAPVLKENLLIDNGAVMAKYSLTIGVNHPEAECETTIPVLIQEKLEENDEVDLKFSPDVFCFNAKADDEKIPMEVKPGNAKVTSDQGDTFIKAKNFIPNQVPDALLGQTIKFKVKNQLVSQTAKVYKLPEPNHFQNKNYEVVVKNVNPTNNSVIIQIIPSTPYDSNAYLTYTWLNANNEILSNEKILSTDVFMDDTQIKETFKLQLGVNNPMADCLEVYNIKVNQTVEIEEQQNCYQAFKSRVANFNVEQPLKAVIQKTAGTPFANKLRQTIIQQVDQTVKKAKGLNSEQFKNNAQLIESCVSLLESLSEDYIQDIEKSNYLSQFMIIHEILVVMVLELSKCKNNSEVAEIAPIYNRFNQVVTADNIMFVEFGINYRALKNTYFNTYQPKSSELLKVKAIILNN